MFETQKFALLEKILFSWYHKDPRHEKSFLTNLLHFFAIQVIRCSKKQYRVKHFYPLYLIPQKYKLAVMRFQSLQQILQNGLPKHRFLRNASSSVPTTTPPAGHFFLFIGFMILKLMTLSSQFEGSP